MSDHPNLEARVAQLDRSLSRSRLMQRGIGLAILLIAVAGLWQLILLRQQVTVLRSNSLESAFWLLCHDHATGQQRTDAFLRLVRAGNQEWQSARLHDLQLAGVDLIDQDLSGADFEATDFSNADFQRAELIGTRLALTNCSAANFEFANLASARILRASLQDANFREAILQSASLQQSMASGADFILADLSEADLLMADLSNCQLTGANLTSSVLRSTNLSRANLSLANLKDAVMTNVNLANSNWWRAHGLSAAQIELYTSEFAPNADADPNVRVDFEDWIADMNTAVDPLDEVAE